MAAILQTSVLAPHLEPRITSGERYCRVWISFVKWWPTQQAFPRSAIFTDIVSIAVARSSWLTSFGVADLLREIPDMVWERFSLHFLLVRQSMELRIGIDTRSLLLMFCIVRAIIRSRFPKTEHLPHRFRRRGRSYSTTHYNAIFRSS